MTKNAIAIKQHQSDASVHLDAIRGIAALIVFLSHGRALFVSAGLRDLVTNAQRSTSMAPVSGQHQILRTSIGHEAVIAFFVLSGYFVGSSVIRAMRKGRFTWSRYLFQRITRLGVVLVPALLLGWLLDGTGIRFLHATTSIYSSPAGSVMAPGLAQRLDFTTFLGNLFFLQGILTKSFGTNEPLWSLAYEFWFYIFFPLLLIALLPRKATLQRVISAVLLIAVMFFCGRDIAQYFVLWLFGAAIEFMPLSLRDAIRKPLISGLIALLLVTMMLELRVKVDLIWKDLLLGVEFTVLTWAILHLRQVTLHSLYRNAAQSLSKVSYTMYLVHMPFYSFLCALVMPVWLPWKLSAFSLLRLSGVYAIVFALVICMYFAFERNTETIRGWLTTSKQAS